MKRCMLLLFCLLLTLSAPCAKAENLTGEVTIDGVTFALDAHIVETQPEEVTRYDVKVRRWGPEPKDSFDISRFLRRPDEAENVSCGNDGQRMYVVDRTFNRYCDEALRFDGLSVEYHTLFGLNKYTNAFTYVDLPDEVLNPYEKQVFETVYRARNPQPDDVPDLKGITYAQALTILDGYRGAFEPDLMIGEPYYVEAWTAENQLAREQRYEDDLLESERYAILDGPEYYVICLRTSPAPTLGLAGFAGYQLGALAVVSENGLERLQAAPFLTDFAPKGASQPMLTAREALAHLQAAQGFFKPQDGIGPRKNEGQESLAHKATIVEIAPELQLQWSEDGGELIPVWAFYVHVESETLSASTHSISWNGVRPAVWKRDEYAVFAIDAVTGERVL